ESNLNMLKNRAMLNYEPPKGKATADVRKAASEADPDVLQASIKLSRAKAAKVALDKKYDIIIKSHHLYKDIAGGFKRTILGNNLSETNKVGWEFSLEYLFNSKTLIYDICIFTQFL